MASPISPPRSPVGSGPVGGGRAYDEFIAQRLRKTRFQVKLVDLLAVLMGLIGGVLGVLLAVVLIDHWVCELGLVGRLAALVVLVGGCGYFVAAQLLPLLLRRINPAYAARAIEQSEPRLKNSLINYLMFRGNTSAASRLARRALQQQAALDLKQVDVNTVVDHSRVIHIGYSVAAIMLIFALYTLFSPKDVFQTIRRVALPWADIARPSRVQITDVLPGDATVVFGQTVTVSTRVVGVKAGEMVQLVYSTDDKQVVDQAVPLQLGEGGLWRATLLPDGTGVEQAVSYRLEAGDARTMTYHLQVVPAPTILVRRIEYEYPAYTRRPPRSDETKADIHAIEGTRVTIHGRTSRPIQTAWIELDPPQAGREDARQPDSQRMRARDQNATFQFWLQLDPQRAAPQHVAYRLKFVDQDGGHSQLAAIHPITIQRDLAPEINVLTPQSEQSEVPENGQQRLEFRALDPDFGLTRITVRAVVGGQTLLDQVLFEEPSGVPGQVVADYDFVPARLGLTAGAEVTFWAVAEDNRQAIGGKQPDPNSARTREYHLLVVPPDPARPANSTSPDQPGDAAPEPTPAQPKPAPDTQQRPSDPTRPAPAQPNAAQSAEQNPAEPPEPSPQPESSDSGQTGEQSQQPGQSAQPSQTSDQQDAAAESQAGAGSGQEQSGTEPQPADQQSPSDGAMGNQGSQAGAEGGQTGQDSQQPQAGDANRQDGQSGSQSGSQSGAAGGASQSTPDGGQSAASGGPQSGQPAGASGAEQSAGSPQGSGGDSSAGATRPGQAGSGGGESPADQAPLHDGEAMERLLEYLQNQDSQRGSGNPTGQQQPAGGQDSSKWATPDVSPGGGDPAAESAAGQPGDQPSSRPAGDNQSPSGSGTEQPGRGDKGQPPGSGSGQTAGAESGKRPADSAAESGTGGKKTPQGASGAGGLEPGAGTDGPGSTGEPNVSDGPPGSAGTPQDMAGQRSGNPSAESAENGGKADAAAGSAGDPGAAGQDAAANATEPTGQPGSPGADGQSQSGAGQDQPGSQPGQDGVQQESADSAGPTSGGAAGSEPGGGGSGRYGPLSGTDDTFVPDGDQANLEYAQQVTDLVLQRLQDQQVARDPRLLDKLGWTPDELRAFVARWQQLKQAAREEAGDGRAELDDALRSLGLRAVKPRQQARPQQDDAVRGLRDSGGRSRPPAAFRDLFDAYRKGATRSQAD